MQTFAVKGRLMARFADQPARAKVVRWRPVALASGGALVIVSGLYNVLIAAGVLDALSGYELYSDEYRWRRLFHQTLFLSVLVGWVLIPAGLSGLRVLADGRIRRALALWGARLAVTSAALVLCVVVYRWLEPYAPSGPTEVYLFYATGFGWLAGLLLLGAAALRTRGLGRWRASPLVLAVVGWPLMPILAHPLVSVLLPPPEYAPFGTPMLFELLFWGPQMLAGLGWMVFALPLARAPRHEHDLAAAEDLALARRLYARAWTGGDLSVIDEIAAPDCVDGYGGGLGPESLKRSLIRLRSTFPDLRFVVEDQTTQDGAVTTRWTASGTDRGGVLWYPPTGRFAVFGGCFRDRFAGGRLVEHRGESDVAHLLDRLGLPPRREGDGRSTTECVRPSSGTKDHAQET